MVYKRRMDAAPLYGGHCGCGRFIDLNKRKSFITAIARVGWACLHPKGSASSDLADGMFNLSIFRLYWILYCSLELRRLHLVLINLIYCYKIIFGLTCLDTRNFFMLSPISVTSGHAYKLYKPQMRERRNFFVETVINFWNFLPKNVNFSSISVLVTDAVASVTNTQVAQKLYRASVNML